MSNAVVGLPQTLRFMPDPVVQESNLAADAVRLLQRHRALVFGVFLLTAATATAFAILLPARYQASSIILIGSRTEHAVSLDDVVSNVATDAEAIAGEIEVLNSRELLEAVGRRLDLVDDPHFNPPLHEGRAERVLTPVVATLRSAARLPGFQAAATVAAGLEEWLAERRSEQSVPAIDTVVANLRDHLTIAPAGRSRAVRVTMTAKSAQAASAIVNAVADVYLEEQLRVRDDGTRDANAWIERQILELKARADRSSQAVAQYRVEHDLVRGRDTLLIQQEGMEVSSQLTAAHKERVEAEAALADAERAASSGRTDAMAAALHSQVIQQLRVQEAKITAQRAELLSRAGSSNPDVVGTASALADVRARIAAEAARIVQSTRDALKVAQAQESALSLRMADIRKQISAADGLDVGLQELQREADADKALYNTFLTRSRETDPRLNYPTVNVRILSRSIPPNWATSPNRKLIILAGLVLGLVCGCAAAFARDMLTRGLRTRVDVERITGAPLLGIIPRVRGQNRMARFRLEEAVTSLWARVVANLNGRPPKSLLITSAVMQEGKTSLARLLAAVLAAQGRRVLLVDADLRCPSLGLGKAGARSTPGLVDLLKGQATLAAAVTSEAGAFDLLPAGRCNVSPVRLLSSPEFTNFLRDAEQAYDLVIIDSPPVLIGADAWLLAANAAATIMLARWGHTPRSTVENGLRQLSDAGARCCGLAFSLVDINRNAYYDDSAALLTSRKARRFYAGFIPSK